MIGRVEFFHGVFGINQKYSNKLCPLHFNEDFYDRKTTKLGNFHQDLELLDKIKI